MKPQLSFSLTTKNQTAALQEVASLDFGLQLTLRWISCAFGDHRGQLDHLAKGGVGGQGVAFCLSGAFHCLRGRKNNCDFTASVQPGSSCISPVVGVLTEVGGARGGPRVTCSNSSCSVFSCCEGLAVQSQTLCCTHTHTT